MKIGVYGSAISPIDAEVNRKARDIGTEIARRNYILITGGCGGLSYEAVLGAHEAGGQCIGYSPGVDLEDHVNRFGFPIENFLS